MSTLVENVAKVTAAHAALKTAIAAKGVAVPDGTKLSAMPALVDQIQTPPVPTNPRAVFAQDTATSIVVPKVMVVDMMAAANLRYFFTGCSGLVSYTLPAGFGASATDLSYFFSVCSSLASIDLPAGFGQAATNIANCFRDCRSLTSLTLPAGFGQAATNIGGCFYGCTVLASLVLPAGFGQAAPNVKYLFCGCTALTSLHLPDGFGRSATDSYHCFFDCTSLTTVTGNPNFKESLDLSPCPKLTHDSIMVVINGLQTVTGKTIALGAANLAKLTDAEKKVATDKGWTLA